MESTATNIYKMPEQKCFRCKQPGHVAAKCPETTENYKNYQEKAIQNIKEEEAQKEVEKQFQAKQSSKVVEENKDEQEDQED